MKFPDIYGPFYAESTDFEEPKSTRASNYGRNEKTVEPKIFGLVSELL